MKRYFAQLLAAVAVAFVVAAWAARPAWAALVWEQSGPAAAQGLTAVATDPGDPRVVWVAGGRSVWVSDDAGDSWSLVLLVTEGTRERTDATADELALDREAELAPAGDDAEDDAEDEFDDDEFLAQQDPLSGQVDDQMGVDGDAGLGAEEDEASDGALARAVQPEAIEASVGGAIVRLRVIGDSVFVATGRGLWAIDRAARTLGSGREVRFGRQVAVLDVAPRAEGGLWLATTRGLLSMEPNGMAVPAQGTLGSQPIRALLALPDGLRVAAPDDVWVLGEGGFVPSGLALPSGAMLDLVAAPGADYAAAAVSDVFLITRSASGAPTVGQAWPVPPPVARVAVGRDGALWAVGGSGVWQRTPDAAGWERRMEGLSQGSLADVAAAREGVAWMWVVGSRGAYRLIPERDRVWSRRARSLAEQALEGVPTVTDVFEAAARHRRVDFETASAWRTQKALSFALPEVRLRALDVRMREEQRPFVPVLGTRITQEVRVVPVRDEVRIEARWNLMPAVTALLGLEPEGGRELQSEIARRLKGRERLRETLSPLYNEWLRLRVLTAASRSAEDRQSLRERLALEQLEADLYAITGGWFAPPPHQASVEAPGDEP